MEPYFKGADGAEAPFRPVTEGDVIQLQLGAQLAEFKVVETEPPRHCIVSPETAIDMEEESLERSVEEVPRPAPARMPAPAPRPIATACRRLPPLITPEERTLEPQPQPQPKPRAPAPRPSRSTSSATTISEGATSSSP